MIPGQELKVFAGQSEPAIARYCQTFARQARKSIGQHSSRTQTISARPYLFDLNRILFKDCKHEPIQRPVLIFGSNLFYKTSGHLRSERIQLEQTIPAF